MSRTKDPLRERGITANQNQCTEARESNLSRPHMVHIWLSSKSDLCSGPSAFAQKGATARHKGARSSTRLHRFRRGSHCTLRHIGCTITSGRGCGVRCGGTLRAGH